MHAFKVVVMAIIVIALASFAGWMVQPKAQLSQTGMGGVAGGGPPNPCTGTIDIGAGCVLPMLGGL